MRMKSFAAAAIALGATAALTTPAQAATTDECQVLIAALSSDTAAADSLSDKARASLSIKAESAAAKLDAGKLTDAQTKLTDYESALNALHLAAKPKVSDVDFVLLSEDVEAASFCVSSLEAP